MPSLPRLNVHVNRDVPIYTYGIKDFGTASFLRTELSAGEAGVTTGFGVFALCTVNTLAAAARLITGRTSSSDTGWAVYISATNNIGFHARNGANTTFVASGLYQLTASDLGKTLLIWGQHNGSTLQLIVGTVESQNFVAIAGYTVPGNYCTIGGVATTATATAAPASGVSVHSVMTYQGVMTVPQVRAYAAEARKLGDLPQTITQGTATTADVEALSPAHWFRMDNVTSSGANLATVPNRVGAGNLAVTVGTIVNPVNNASFANQPTITLSATQGLDSSLAASTWGFFHKGTGFEDFVIAKPTTATGVNIMLATRPAAGLSVGATHYWNPNHAMANGNGAATIFAPIVITVPVLSGVPRIFNASYSEAAVPKGVLKHTASVDSAGAPTGTPSASDPTATLRVGMDTSGGSGASMELADLIIFDKVLTEAQREIVRDYVRTRFGIGVATVTHYWSARKEASSLTSFAGLTLYGGRGFVPGYLKSANGAGIRGNAAGFFVAAVISFENFLLSGFKTITKLSSADSNGWALGTSGTTLRFITFSGGIAYISPTYTLGAVDLEKPKLIIGVFTGAAVRLYVDGVQIGTETVASFTSDNASAAMFAGTDTSATQVCPGRLFSLSGGDSAGGLSDVEISNMFSTFLGTGTIPTLGKLNEHKYIFADSSGVPATVNDLIGVDHLSRISTVELAVDKLTAPATPAYLPDRITAAVNDRMTRVGSPRVELLDNVIKDGRDIRGIEGFGVTNAYEGPAGSGAFTGTGSWVAWWGQINGTSTSTTPWLFDGSFAVRGTATNWSNVALASSAGTTTFNFSGLFLQPFIMVCIYTGTALRWYVDTGSGPQQVGADTAATLGASQPISFGRRVSNFLHNGDNHSWFGASWGAIPGGPSLTQVVDLCASIKARGHIQGIPGATLHLWDPLLDIAASGNHSPAQILDRVGTDHLSNTSALVYTRGGAKGVRLCVSSPTTGGRVAPYYRTPTTAGGIPGIAGALHVSAKITVENQTAQNNHTLVSTFNTSPSNSGFILALNSNNTQLFLAIYAGGGTQASSMYTVTPGNVGTPIYVDGVFTGTQLQLFVDGVQVGTDVAASYTPSTSATYIGVDARDLAVTAAENVTIHAVSGGNTSITSGEVATRYSASLLSGSLEQIPTKTQRHWSLELDVVNDIVPGISSDRTGTGDSLVLVGSGLQVAQRTERSWLYSTSPILYGIGSFTLNDHYQMAGGFAASPAGFWRAVLWRCDTQAVAFKSARMLFAQRDSDTNRGWQIWTTGSNASMFVSVSHTSGTSAISAGAIAATEVGKLRLTIFVLDTVAARVRSFDKRVEVTNTSIAGTFQNSAVPMRIGRDDTPAVDYSADGCTVFGVAGGDGIPTLQEIQAFYDATMASEQIKTIPGKTQFSVNVPAGSSAPATLTDGPVTFTKSGTPSLVTMNNRSWVY